MNRIKNGLREIASLRRIYSDFMHARYAVREGLWTAFFRRAASRLPIQKPLTWNIPTTAYNIDDIRQALVSLRVPFSEGSLAIYLPPSPKLQSFLGPELIEFYPRDSGFKVLKDLRPPEKANYLAGKSGPSAFRKTLIGPPEEQLVAGNVLWSLNLGPRIYDLCGISFNKLASGTMFVVEHVNGETPTNEAHAEFIGSLKKALSETSLRITLPNWEAKSDFEQPKCNGNLIVSEGKLRYVDFQNFRVSDRRALVRATATSGEDDLHFGQSRAWRKQRYLYQSIPGISGGGKRNTSKRWTFLEKALNHESLAVQGRIVLDIGCNSGMILAQSLASGASWALGWDRPHVAPHAERILLALGCSRVTLTGAMLNAEYPIPNDIPKRLQNKMAESIVFYLSVREHIGMNCHLATLPWKVFVYEGHQKETIQQAKSNVEYLLNSARISAETLMADGDSAPRPLLILVRK